jgi:hypothetical protein
MVVKKSTLVLFGISVISAWILGSVTQAGAETMKCKTVTTATKEERIAVGDEEGHFLGMRILQGLALFENGEIAKLRVSVLYDSIPGKGAQVISYYIFTFEDGSTIVTRDQPLISRTGSAKITGELTKGTGRFQGIKGTTSGTGRSFPPTEKEAGRLTFDYTLTYTLPAK